MDCREEHLSFFGVVAWRCTYRNRVSVALVAINRRRHVMKQGEVIGGPVPFGTPKPSGPVVQVPSGATAGEQEK